MYTSGRVVSVSSHAEPEISSFPCFLSLTGECIGCAGHFTNYSPSITDVQIRQIHNSSFIVKCFHKIIYLDSQVDIILILGEF